MTNSWLFTYLGEDSNREFKDHLWVFMDLFSEPKIEHFWTSGSDLGEEGQFVLLATGKKFNFTHWRYPQPDNAGKIEHCTEIWKLREKRYNWNDVSCANNFNFICEVQKCTDLCKSWIKHWNYCILYVEGSLLRLVFPGNTAQNMIILTWSVCLPTFWQ